ncbi:MAG: outer membrane protein OmpA-like peptidoglycan-associated protein [Paracoccaceae bacterium]|jgi:outer membrane protein OmpA-like peptidoglycan-associated protein
MTQLKTIITVVTIGAVGLVGCTTTNPNPNANRTRDGAIIGAILGGVIGAAGSDTNSGRSAVVGAVVGAAAGGIIGQQLDRQAQELRSDLSNDQIKIENTGSELIVTMPEGILFDIDSAAIRAGLQRDVRALASNLQDYPDSTVDVIGHTDNTGSASYNQDLSARRAGAVAGVLLEAGVANFRVRSYGRGENEPVATNLTPEGRQQNRRVEIIIRPSA